MKKRKGNTLRLISFSVIPCLARGVNLNCRLLITFHGACSRQTNRLKETDRQREENKRKIFFL
jgi:hypothetical protein